MKVGRLPPESQVEKNWEGGRGWGGKLHPVSFHVESDIWSLPQPHILGVSVPTCQIPSEVSTDGRLSHTLCRSNLTFLLSKWNRNPHFRRGETEASGPQQLAKSRAEPPRFFHFVRTFTQPITQPASYTHTLPGVSSLFICVTR